MNTINRLLTPRADLALFILRIWIGIVGVFHGSQKLFSAFDGPGIQGFQGYLTTLKVPFPVISAYAASLTELAGGLLIAFGLFTRPAAALLAFTMAVAALTAHAGKFDAQKGGGEYPLTIGILAAAIFIAGPGALSIRRLFHAPALKLQAA